MKTLTLSFLLFFLIGFILISCQNTPTDEKTISTSSSTVPTESKANPLEGVWLTLANSWNTETKEFADKTHYKIYTKDRFAFIFFTDDEFTAAGGGTYNYDRTHFTEKIEYFSPDSTAVGSEFKFRYEIYGDTLLRQSGAVHSEKFPDYQFDQFYIRKEAGISSISDKKEAVGVWELETATYGENKSGAEEIKEQYGRVIKIITPGYFYGAFFNKDTKVLNGVGFGTVEIDDTKYTETMTSFSWDNSAVDKVYTFDWAIENGKYHQTGKINSEQYTDYVIDELFTRLE